MVLKYKKLVANCCTLSYVKLSEFFTPCFKIFVVENLDTTEHQSEKNVNSVSGKQWLLINDFFVGLLILEIHLERTQIK